MGTEPKIHIVSASAYQYFHFILNSLLFLSVTAQVGLVWPIFLIYMLIALKESQFLFVFKVDFKRNLFFV